MKKTLVVGVGSVLCGDDGIGMRVIDQLENEKLPEGTRLHAADISGLDLLKYFPDNDEVIIIDSADMGEEPGTIRVFDPKEIKPATFKEKFSTHGMALLETLTLADKLNMASSIKVIGIQPKETGFKLQLSEVIKNTIPKVIEKVKELIGKG